MSLVSISKVSHYFTDKPILKDTSLSLEKDDCIGLIGKNGIGKTTLLDIITHKIEPTSGEVHTTKNLQISYLKQNIAIDGDITLYEYILSSATEYNRLKEKLEHFEYLVSQNHSDGNMKKLSDIQAQFDAIDGYAFESRIKLILTALNFPKTVWNQKIDSFSGGEKTRIQLAKILLEEFDYLLMDEPTNHLDIEMIYWVERYLKSLNKPYLIISHDRYFLNRMVTKILHLANGKIATYKGNYDSFVREAEIRLLQNQKQIRKQEQFIKKTEEFIAKNIEGQKVKQAKSRRKMLDKMQAESPIHKEKDIKFKIESGYRSGNDIFVIKNLSFGFPDKILAEDVTLDITYKDRIVLIGKNGSGKTTFLRLLSEEIYPIKGEIKKGASLSIGYYDQMHINLNPYISVFDTIQELVPMATQGYIFSYMAKYGFRAEETEKIVGNLSGGEKARLYLAKLIHNKPNLLILDEPTNHLDISMIQSVENALLNYDGTIIFVSHDRAFIKKIATRILHLNNNKITEYYSDIDELFIQQTKQEKKVVEKKIERKKIKKTNPILLELKQKEVDEVSKKLEDKENLLTEFQAKFSDPNFMKNSNNVKKINEEIDNLKVKIEKIQNKMDELETEYLLMLEEE